SAVIATATTIFGPFISVPCLAAIGGMAFLSYSDRHRAALCVMVCLAVIVPSVAGYYGLLPTAYAFDGSRFSMSPVALFFPAGPTFATMLISNVGFILMGMAL